MNLSDVSFLEVGEDPTIRLSAEELTRAIEEDDLDAFEKYERMPLLVTGAFLKDVGQSSAPWNFELVGHTAVDGREMTVRVHCQKEKRSITPGQQMTLQGRCQFDDRDHVKVVNARFVEE